MAIQQHEVYGVVFETPHIPPKLEIDGYEKRKADQKFRRVEIPKSFYDVEFDEDGNGLYSDEQWEFIEQQQYHIEHGFWFYNYGEPTYITGLNYFYLNFWVLDTDIYPEYRDADKKWFYFQRYCESKRFIDGIIRVKKRREGATSQAACSLVYDAIMNTVAFCGIVSKDKDTASDVFNSMVSHGYNNLPDFLKVRCEDPDSKTKLIFNEKAIKAKRTKKKGQVFGESRGLGSRIDFKPTKLNSYDGGRLTKILIDEAAKWEPDIPIEKYWPIVRKTMKQGVFKVGFALMPSTTNRGEKGGTGFKKIWDDSNHTAGERTGSGMYRYFAPAYEGLAGYIDEYGFSIVDKPTPEQKKHMMKVHRLDEFEASMGAKERILYNRSLITDADGLKLEILDYPLSENEAFEFSEDDNIYDTKSLYEQREYLLNRNVKKRRVRFYETFDGKVDFVDDPNGYWQLLYMPEEGERNAFHEKHGKKKPANAHKYVIPVDPFKSTIKIGPGSDGAALIMRKMSELDPENSGMPIAMFLGRPKLKSQLHDQMLFAARFYGAEMLYEMDYDDVLEYVANSYPEYVDYIAKKPENAIDPTRKKSAQGQYLKSADSFALASMIRASVEYVIRYAYKIYFLEIIDAILVYKHEKRTDHDLVVAFQIGCLAIQAPIKQKKEVKKTTVLRTFDLTKRLN